MESVVEALAYFHADHLRWQNELAFAKQELSIFNHRLEQVVVNTGDKETLAEVEHFQNQFIREQEVIDTLMHEVGVEEQKISLLAQQDNTSIGQFDMERHLALADEMVMFSRLYADLRHTFNKFLMRTLKGMWVVAGPLGN